MRTIAGFSILFLSALSGTAEAGLEDVVRFRGDIEPTCSVTLKKDGTLSASTDLKTLTSRAFGGESGGVEVFAGGDNFQVSASSPIFVSAPEGSETSVTAMAFYRGSGATSFSDRSHADGATGLETGTTTIDVDFEAEKQSGSFRKGHYETSVTITCEPANAGS